MKPEKHIATKKAPRLKLDVVVHGLETQDLAEALKAVLEMVANGYTNGFNMNQTSRFNFEVTEEGTDGQ
jgi:hypothetical protein